mmetsp:Transcript_8451/g.22627  ORF Transcript_8451/g.22627 Transcript_8451/m.22627 type:complete len:83 (-) Transcript_8451:233-481(-)
MPPTLTPEVDLVSQTALNAIDDPPSKRTRSKCKETAITTKGRHSSTQNINQTSQALPTQENLHLSPRTTPKIDTTPLHPQKP